MKTLIKVLLGLLLVGCGDEYMTPEEQAALEEAQAQAEYDAKGYFRLEGYVSPINIYVNDEFYSDSEDFYTREVDRLQEMMADAYPNYTLSFEANIGLKDFKRGLQAFLTPKNDMGIASETSVDDSGAFSFTLPKRVDYSDDMYLIRISKRIGLKLTNGENVIYQCYNFYAQKNIKPTENEAVLLRVFQTSLTKYKCSDDSDNYITIPTPPKVNSTDDDSTDDSTDDDDDEKNHNKKEGV
jgi:hypothetical protein